MQPIIFDHVNKVVIQVGKDPGADRRYAEILAANAANAQTSSAGSPPAR